jgi:exodeoxyribonuclease-5
MSDVTLSPDQVDAFDKIMEWIRSYDPDRPFFKLFGWAGTGKTTLAKSVADEVADVGSSRVAYGAYTGKAAQVLRRKTGRDATTLHRLAYRIKEKDKDGNPIFERDPDSGLGALDLLVVDECSMIGVDVMVDLLSFGCPILCIGDPGQLPPVKAQDFFQDNPDAMLTEIHRQAAGNPIIQLATKIRLGDDYHDVGGTVQFYDRRVDKQTLIDADQLLCGTNQFRHAGNAHMRKLYGYEGDRPGVDEQVVCLKNNHVNGYQNGQTFVVKYRDDYATGMVLEIVDIDGNFFTTDFVDERPFQGLKTAWTKGIDQFAFGYMLTVHKAQGSEWPHVIVYNERFQKTREEYKRWFYTAVTRASSEIGIVE